MRAVRLLAPVFLFSALTVNAQAGVIYSQTSDYPSNYTALTSQSQASGANYQTYDNFAVTSIISPTDVIDALTWQGIYFDTRGPGFNPPPNPNLLSFKIGFFTNQNNVPGTLIGSAITLNVVGTPSVVGQSIFNGNSTVNVYNFTANLASPFTITKGTTYWLSIVSFPSATQPLFLWTSGTGGDNKSAQLNYATASTILVSGDRAFSLLDTVQTTGLRGSGPPQNEPVGTLEDAGVPEPATWVLAVMGLVGGGARRLLRRRGARD